MLRRNFLKALVIAATMPAIDAHASTATPVANATPVVHPYQKYVDALVLYDATVAVHQEYREAQKLNPGGISSKALQDSANVFLTFLMTNFKKPSKPGDPEYAVDIEQLNAILDIRKPSDESCQSLLRDVPPRVTEVAWVVAAVKSMLSEHKMPLNPKQSSGFDEFIYHYKDIILTSV